MIAVVAVDECWGIGYKGELLYEIPEDRKFFKERSEHKVVVMGRATLESLPGSKPLRNRTNIVLTKKRELEQDSVIVCSSVEQLLEAVSTYDPDDVVVMGGQEIYTQLLDYCTTAYVTRIKGRKTADRFFPRIDLLDNWKVEDISDEKNHEGIKFAFYKYVNTDLSKTDKRR